MFESCPAEISRLSLSHAIPFIGLIAWAPKNIKRNYKCFANVIKHMLRKTHPDYLLLIVPLIEVMIESI